MKRSAALGGLVALSASLLVACGDAPDNDDSPKANDDFLPCMLSDEGGFDDKSFNQVSHEGFMKAVEELGSESKSIESNSAVDYAPNLENMAAEGCDPIISVGFNLAGDTVKAANANPDNHFMLIDSDGDLDADGKVDAENLKPVTFNSAQASFLAGYAAADYSKTGKVGTYGGAPIPSVTIFMDGFVQGVEFYNEEKNKDVKVVGWDREKETGSFTGSFNPDAKATNTARQVLGEDVDVIFPVGGPIYQGAVTVINEEKLDATIIGVDSDLAQTDKKIAPMVLVSVLKDLGSVTEGAVMDVSEGSFDTTPYLGTLENGGVSLSPFHDFESKIRPDLQDELDAISDAIKSGDQKVESYLD
ncbi:BMP family lipoprotein [Nocardioides daphniae]|uniref:BMP family ABC transporter substrate-binding protein n=1 Tax=Nocardioides daphniae TaxID=402297 RepID=A0A4V1CWN7_9ACTN|nr:BMP family ABC transporter substrate-binding protein [Nocardioides daphniae]QCC77907.1 BMP family ABC transporter substrate-binding protein [Nocardioides daphniae]GGD24143.1 BMP family ABC transporter substrate-binding protein [Nocardioides daphniae]